MATDRLIAIVVLVLTIGASAFVAKQFQLPELYAAAGLLVYFLGTLTGKPTTRNMERKLRKMPRPEIDRLYERITGRPPRSNQQDTAPVRLENGE